MFLVGMLTLFPMTVAPVCRIGDPLQLTCTASVVNIQWSFTVVNQRGMDETVMGFSTAGALAYHSVLFRVNSTIFTLIRNSSQNDLPLIVTLSIDSVSAGLNGTEVNCIDEENSSSSGSTAIQIVGMSEL
jgi:hypothetical protein